jgi:cation transport regulator ChaC
MKETTYRGYRIFYQYTVEWFGNITRPGRRLRLEEPLPSATLEEGEEVLLRRLRTYIDRLEGEEM